MSKKGSLYLVILWMFIIFVMSSMPGGSSNGASKMILNTVLDKTNVVNKTELAPEKINNSKSLFNKMHYFFRKSSHFSEYLVLALLILNHLRFYNNKNYIKVIICIFICFIYSITDEIHQIFVPNRTPLFKDCLIDTSGAIVGCLIAFIIISVSKILKQINRSNKVKI